MAADYSNMHFADEVHEHIVAAEGELTALGILHLPRLRESELRRNRTFLRGQTRQFMREFAAGQAALPFERRWQLEGYHYFTYLKPPYQLIFQRYREIHPDQVASMYEQTDDGPVPSLHFANFILTYGYGLPDYSLNQLPNTEIGTSFGLNATRVYHVMTQVHDEVAGVSFYIAVPRICIGLRATSQSVKRLAETLAAKTSELMTQL